MTKYNTILLGCDNCGWSEANTGVPIVENGERYCPVCDHNYATADGKVRLIDDSRTFIGVDYSALQERMTRHEG